MNKFILTALVIAFATIISGCTSSGSTGSVVSTASAGERKVAVLSDEAQSLTLKVGGQAISLNPSWRKTGRGYEATVRFPAALMSAGSATLIRADKKGWSDWGSAEMRYLRSHDVRGNDPACVGGKAWCATRGL